MLRKKCNRDLTFHSLVYNKALFPTHTGVGPNSGNEIQYQIWICLCLEIRLSKVDTDRRDRMA